MDECVALHVIMLVTLAVNDTFQAKVRDVSAPLVGKAGFHAAPPKGFERANNKMTSPADYRFHAQPRCLYNVDVVRNMVSAATPAQAKQVLAALCREFGGYAKIKNLFALSNAEQEDRFHLLSIMVTVCFDAGRTYRDIASDPRVQKKWAAYAENGAGSEPRERWRRHTARAVAFLSSEHMASTPVRILGETQILLADYTRVRHGMHEPYRVWRAANPTSLFHDFARSSGVLRAQSDGSTLVNAASRGQVSAVPQTGSLVDCVGFATLAPHRV